MQQDRFAVVTNPRSGANRRDPGLVERLRRVAGAVEVHTPASLEELEALARAWAERPPKRLAVHGGDGTLHQVITAILRVSPDAPLPELVPLRGGTMNIVASSVGVRARAEPMLERALREPCTLQIRRTLRVEVDGAAPVHGFLFGNGIVARFLEKYYERPDPTPADAAALLLRGALSALAGGALARELVRPYEGSVSVDGVRLPGDRWTAVALGTVEQMGLGFRVFHLLRERPEELQVVAIGGSVGALALELPSLYRGRGVRRPGNSALTGRELRLESGESIPLMVDGDFYRADRGQVRVSVGPPVRWVT